MQVALRVEPIGLLGPRRISEITTGVRAMIVDGKGANRQQSGASLVESVVKAYPAGTLLGDLLSGTEVELPGVDVCLRAAIDARLCLVRVTRNPRVGLTEGDAHDLLRANAGLVGRAVCWSIDPPSGALVLTCAIGTAMLARETDGFGRWAKAVAEVFAGSSAILERPRAAGRSRVDDLKVLAAPIDAFRRGCSCGVGQACAESCMTCLDTRAVADETAISGEDAHTSLMIDDSFQLDVTTRSCECQRIVDVEARLNERGSRIEVPASYLAALGGGVDEALHVGASVVGSLIEDDRLVRCWRFRTEVGASSDRYGLESLARAWLGERVTAGDLSRRPGVSDAHRASRTEGEGHA